MPSDIGSGPRAFVVGQPIAHSRSPLIHGHWLARHGIAGSYERVAVAPEDFPAFVRGLAAAGFAGGNVTIPHKEAALALADGVTPTAARIGAVNTLVVGPDGRVEGDNTDAYGFVAHCEAGLGPGWLDRHGGTALVLGAGGAARAVVVGLLDRGFERVVVANRGRARAEALAALDPRIAVADWADLPDRLPEAGFLVNTTSLGMAGQPALDLDLAGLPDRAAVADIVYVPLETPLLAAARERNLPALDGLGMLLHQAVPGFARWFGTAPAVTPELRALVAADIPA